MKGSGAERNQTHSLLLILRLLMNFIATWCPVSLCFPTA